MKKLRFITFICGLLMLPLFARADGTVMERSGIIYRPIGFWASQISDVNFSNAVVAVAPAGGGGGSGISASTATNIAAYQAAIATNALATYARGLTNNFVTATVTNGLSPISYLLSATNDVLATATARFTTGTNAAVAFATMATNDLAAYARGLTNNFVTSSVTNGLAPISLLNTSSNYLYSQLTAGGITATEGTNIAAYQAQIATNDLNTSLVAKLTTGTNAAVAFATATTNSLISYFIKRQIEVNNPAPTATDTNWTINVTNNFGAPMDHLYRLHIGTNANLTFVATSTNAALSLEITSSNSVIVNVTFPTNSVRLIPTNNATVVGTTWKISATNGVTFVLRTNAVAGKLLVTRTVTDLP